MSKINIDNKISITEICNGRKLSVQFYGPHSLNEDGTIMPFEEQMAIVSHYLHNQGYRYAKPYEEKAIGLLEDIYNIRNEKLEYTCASEPAVQYSMFSDLFAVPFLPSENPKFTFIDLFAGMGGFRLAMQAQGGKCVFSSEWNSFAQKTYLTNFGEVPFGDITRDETKRYIPKDFDILCAGFPCQPFSIAGVSKKKSLGRETGFKDKTQGTLFFDVAKIVEEHRPRVVFLENVKNLLSHDKGNTFKVIRETLEELNYSIHYRVMDGKSYVPQHRERIMIVGFDRNIYHGNENFKFPDEPETQHKISSILESNPDNKYTLSDKLWGYLQNYAIRQKEKGNGFGFGLVDLNGISRTLSARYYKDGSEILIPQDDRNPRKLTPRECARLMGYPDSYILSAVSDVQAYRQCGNSVIVPLITAVSEQIVKAMKI